MAFYQYGHGVVARYPATPLCNDHVGIDNRYGKKQRKISMILFTLIQAGYVALGLEILLLLVGIIATMNNSGNDPAGRGMAQGIIVLYLIYIGIHWLMLLSGNRYCAMAVIAMAAVPFLLMLNGLRR